MLLRTGGRAGYNVQMAPDRLRIVVTATRWKSPRADHIDVQRATRRSEIPDMPPKSRYGKPDRHRSPPPDRVIGLSENSHAARASNRVRETAACEAVVAIGEPLAYHDDPDADHLVGQFFRRVSRRVHILPPHPSSPAGRTGRIYPLVRPPDGNPKEKMLAPPAGPLLDLVCKPYCRAFIIPETPRHRISMPASRTTSKSSNRFTTRSTGNSMASGVP